MEAKKSVRDGGLNESPQGRPTIYSYMPIKSVLDLFPVVKVFGGNFLLLTATSNFSGAVEFVFAGSDLG